LIELLLELFLVEQLAAGDAIDLRTQVGDTVFIGELHFRLTADQSREHVVAKGEIGAGGDRPYAHDDEAADHNPEGDRAEPDLTAGMAERVIGSRRAVAMRCGMCARLRVTNGLFDVTVIRP
jgi:hypothetical protein